MLVLRFAGRTLCRSLLILSIGASDIQAQMAISVTGGWAAGVDSPFLRNGGLGVSATVWRERPASLEFGFQAGYDVHQDRVLVSGALFFDPANNATRVSTCTGCIAGAFRQEDRDAVSYVGPVMRLRARTGSIRPWVSTGLAAATLHRRNTTAFVPATMQPELGRSQRRERVFTGAAHAGAGLSIAVQRRVSVEIVSQLLAAPQIGDDFLGGAVYTRFGAGLAIR